MNDHTNQTGRSEQPSENEIEHADTTTTRTRTRTERLSRRTVLAITAGAGMTAAVGGQVTAQDTQTVTIEMTADEIDAGETTEAAVSISELPRGLSGLLGDVRVDDADVATIVDATINEDFDMVQDPEISDDGSTVNLVAADTGGNFSEGDTDVELFTLELEGQGDGETEIVLEELIEAGDGTFYEFDLEGAGLTVSDESASQLPGFGAGAAITGLAGGIAYALRDRRRRS